MAQGIKALNKLLKETYGSYDDGRPWFRISWSTTQRETRWGIFREFVGSIFLREYRGVKENAHKYSWIKDRWILEKLTLPPRSLKYWTPEIIGLENGSYEPVWCFNKNGEYQKPEWWACQRLVKAALVGPFKMNQDDLDTLEREKFEKEVNTGIEILEDQESDFQHGLHSRSLIIRP